MVERTGDMRILATELVKRVNDETRRIRLAEQRLDRTDAEVANLENTVSAHASDNKAQLDAINKSLKAMSDRLLVLEGAVGRIEKELVKRVTKAEFKQMESYMSLMSPITSKFVTKEEMERAIEDRVAKKY